MKKGKFLRKLLSFLLVFAFVSNMTVGHFDLNCFNTYAEEKIEENLPSENEEGEMVLEKVEPESNEEGRLTFGAPKNENQEEIEEVGENKSEENVEEVKKVDDEASPSEIGDLDEELEELDEESNEIVEESFEDEKEEDVDVASESEIEDEESTRDVKKTEKKLFGTSFSLPTFDSGTLTFDTIDGDFTWASGRDNTNYNACFVGESKIVDPANVTKIVITAIEDDANVSYAFGGDAFNDSKFENLETVEIGSIGNNVNAICLFASDKKLKSVVINSIGSNVKLSYAFNSDNLLEDATIDSIGKDADLYMAFTGCIALENVNQDSDGKNKISINDGNDCGHTSIGHLFEGTKALTNMEIEVSGDAYMYGMFYGAEGLEKVKITGKVMPTPNAENNIQGVGYLKDMFVNCTSLKELDLGDFDIDVSNVYGLNSYEDYLKNGTSGDEAKIVWGLKGLAPNSPYAQPFENVVADKIIVSNDIKKYIDFSSLDGTYYAVDGEGNIDKAILYKTNEGKESVDNIVSSSSTKLFGDASTTMKSFAEAPDGINEFINVKATDPKQSTSTETGTEKKLYYYLSNNVLHFTVDSSKNYGDNYVLLSNRTDNTNIHFTVNKDKIYKDGGIEASSSEYQNAKTLKLDDAVKPDEINYLFSNLSYVENINLDNKMDLTDVKDYSHMFYNCPFLKSVNGVDFSNVENAESMFEGCHQTLDIPRINARTIINAKRMFADLNIVDNAVTAYDKSFFSKFDGKFEKLEYADEMFLNRQTTAENNNSIDAYKFTLIDISMFDFSKMKSARYMFKNAFVKNDYIKGFGKEDSDGKYVITLNNDLDLTGIFEGNNIKWINTRESIEGDGYDRNTIDNIHVVTELYFDCGSHKLTIAEMFKDCKRLRDVNVNISSTNSDDLNFEGAFAGCINTLHVNINATSSKLKVANVQEMFMGATRIEEVNFKNFDMSSVTSTDIFKDAGSKNFVSDHSIQLRASDEFTSGSNIKYSAVEDKAIFVNAIIGSNVNDDEIAKANAESKYITYFRGCDIRELRFKVDSNPDIDDLSLSFTNGYCNEFIQDYYNKKDPGQTIVLGSNGKINYSYGGANTDFNHFGDPLFKVLGKVKNDDGTYSFFVQANYITFLHNIQGVFSSVRDAKFNYRPPKVTDPDNDNLSLAEMILRIYAGGVVLKKNNDVISSVIRINQDGQVYCNCLGDSTSNGSLGHRIFDFDGAPKMTINNSIYKGKFLDFRLNFNEINNSESPFYQYGRVDGKDVGYGNRFKFFVKYFDENDNQIGDEVVFSTANDKEGTGGPLTHRATKAERVLFTDGQAWLIPDEAVKAQVSFIDARYDDTEISSMMDYFVERFGVNTLWQSARLQHRDKVISDYNKLSALGIGFENGPYKWTYTVTDNTSYATMKYYESDTSTTPKYSRLVAVGAVPQEIPTLNNKLDEATETYKIFKGWKIKNNVSDDLYDFNVAIASKGVIELAPVFDVGCEITVEDNWSRYNPGGVGPIDGSDWTYETKMMTPGQKLSEFNPRIPSHEGFKLIGYRVVGDETRTVLQDTEITVSKNAKYEFAWGKLGSGEKQIKVIIDKPDFVGEYGNFSGRDQSLLSDQTITNPLDIGGILCSSKCSHNVKWKENHKHDFKWVFYGTDDEVDFTKPISELSSYIVNDTITISPKIAETYFRVYFESTVPTKSGRSLSSWFNTWVKYGEKIDDEILRKADEWFGEPMVWYDNIYAAAPKTDYTNNVQNDDSAEAMSNYNFEPVDFSKIDIASRGQYWFPGLPAGRDSDLKPVSFLVPMYSDTNYNTWKTKFFKIGENLSLNSREISEIIPTRYQEAEKYNFVGWYTGEYKTTTTKQGNMDIVRGTSIKFLNEVPFDGTYPFTEQLTLYAKFEKKPDDELPNSGNTSDSRYGNNYSGSGSSDASSTTGPTQQTTAQVAPNTAAMKSNTQEAVQATKAKAQEVVNSLNVTNQQTVQNTVNAVLNDNMAKSFMDNRLQTAEAKEQAANITTSLVANYVKNLENANQQVQDKELADYANTVMESAVNVMRVAEQKDIALPVAETSTMVIATAMSYIDSDALKTALPQEYVQALKANAKNMDVEKIVEKVDDYMGPSNNNKVTEKEAVQKSTLDIQPDQNNELVVKDATGNPVTGFTKINNDGKDGVYFLDDGGKIVTGAVRDITGDTYYFGSDGTMLTGAQNINGAAVNIDASGKVISGAENLPAYDLAQKGISTALNAMMNIS